MRLQTVGGAARRLELSASRIRQLDNEGVLPATLRDSAGRRLYDPDAIERFAIERERQRAAASADGTNAP